MTGLPTETDEDIEGIGRICALIKGVYKKKPRKKQLRISVSCSTFIPKPFTPFQWEKQASDERIAHAREVLVNCKHLKGVALSWSDPFTARLEAVLARGDRRLSKVIRAAYENGCIFDSWDKELNKDGWNKAFESTGISPDEYTREFGETETLPWDFIDIGVTKKFLLAERAKAYSGKVTGSCLASCKGCGMQAYCPQFTTLSS